MGIETGTQLVIGPQAGQGGNPVAPKRVEFGYDVAGRPGTVYRYANLEGTQLVATSVLTFDNASRLTNMAHVVPGTPLQVLTYAWTFDRAGRITQEVSSTDGTAVYGQDDTGQLTSANYTYVPDLPDQTFGYDANGNRITNGFTVEATGNNRMDTGAGFHYEYDNEGNRTRRYVDANANGVLDAGDTYVTEYAWDYRNRLVSVTDRVSYGAASNQVVEYVYDYANRLVTRTLDPDGDGGTAAIQQTAFVYDGDQILLQFEKEGAGDLVASDLRHRYLWGPAVDQILADESVGGGLAEDVLWPLTDHLGTVRDLAEYNSGNPQVVCHRVYDVFGNRQDTTTTDFLFGFTGRLFDKDTKLQSNLHRWYDALVGRWLSEDPIGFDAGDANLSRYVGNAPTNKTDPTGLGEIVKRGDKWYYDDGLFEKLIVRIYRIESIWDSYDRQVAAGTLKPGWFTRCVSAPVAKVFLPRSEPDIVMVLEDGTKVIILGGGPSSGALWGQAMALMSVWGTANTVAGVLTPKPIFKPIMPSAEAAACNEFTDPLRGIHRPGEFPKPGDYTPPPPPPSGYDGWLPPGDQYRPRPW
ncbi:MAG: RHS repeat-associated core domain-containing protein [Pirellulales bacterium]